MFSNSALTFQSFNKNTSICTNSIVYWKAQLAKFQGKNTRDRESKEAKDSQNAFLYTSCEARSKQDGEKDEKNTDKKGKQKRKRSKNRIQTRKGKKGGIKESQKNEAGRKRKENGTNKDG